MNSSHAFLPGRRLPLVLLLALLGGVAGTLTWAAPPKDGKVPQLPYQKPVGRLELVATFTGPMPTGVTVSHGGRIFVNFPRWEDKVESTVAEIRAGKTVAYPSTAFNRLDRDHPSRGLVSVQSVVVDPRDRLWILDTGSINFQPSLAGGPKLVGVDLKTDRVFKTISFPRDVVPAASYLNDVRFDLRRGKAGLAFITDSGDKGPNGIVVVDLASGKSWRHLAGHPSVKAEPGFLPLVEGRPLLTRTPDQPPRHLKMGSDGIAISSDGKRLFYCPLAGRRLYSVSVDALADPAKSEDEVARTVIDHGDKGGGSDGLETDDKDRLYLSNYEHNAILRRSPDGSYETLVSDPLVLWPDTLSVAADGFLYFTCNQLHRMARFHEGKDLRVKPYSLFRIRIDAGPIRLR